MTFRIAIDVGGTFTDFALMDDATGHIRIGKRLTSPEDPSVSVLAGVDEIASLAGIAVAALTEALHATPLPPTR